MTQPLAAPLVLEAPEVRRHLPALDARAEMHALFAALAAGEAVQPAQTLTLFPKAGGDFITYLGAHQGASSRDQVFGAKLSPYLPRPEGAVITAWTLLMSAETGRPLLLCDAGELTILRTAATTALAVELLAPRAAKTLALIGAGRPAEAHIEQVRPLRDWAEIRVFAPSLAEVIPDWISCDPQISVAHSAEDAAQGADVVMLCTSSGTPVIATEAIPETALVTSISTNVAKAHEVAPEFLSCAQVYCDYKATTPASAGEMVLAAEAGWSPDNILGDLADLVSGTAPVPRNDQPTFFRSIGLGLEDIFIAKALYTRVTR